MTGTKYLALVGGLAALTGAGMMVSYHLGASGWLQPIPPAPRSASVPSASTPPLPLLLPRARVVLPASPDDVGSWFGEPGVARDPDNEVCRSINTTCSGVFDQTRCTKSKTSWSAILTPGQANCIVAAQGLVYRDDRARWIQNCDPRINCH